MGIRINNPPISESGGVWEIIGSVKGATLSITENAKKYNLVIFKAIRSANTFDEKIRFNNDGTNVYTAASGYQSGAGAGGRQLATVDAIYMGINGGVTADYMNGWFYFENEATETVKVIGQMAYDGLVVGSFSGTFPAAAVTQVALTGSATYTAGSEMIWLGFDP